MNGVSTKKPGNHKRFLTNFIQPAAKEPLIENFKVEKPLMKHLSNYLTNYTSSESAQVRSKSSLNGKIKKPQPLNESKQSHTPMLDEHFKIIQKYHPVFQKRTQRKSNQVGKSKKLVVTHDEQVKKENEELKRQIEILKTRLNKYECGSSLEQYADVQASNLQDTSIVYSAERSKSINSIKSKDTVTYKAYLSQSTKPIQDTSMTQIIANSYPKNDQSDNKSITTLMPRELGNVTQDQITQQTFQKIINQVIVNQHEFSLGSQTPDSHTKNFEISQKMHDGKQSSSQHQTKSVNNPNSEYSRSNYDSKTLNQVEGDRMIQQYEINDFGEIIQTDYESMFNERYTPKSKKSTKYDFKRDHEIIISQKLSSINVPTLQSPIARENNTLGYLFEVLKSTPCSSKTVNLVKKDFLSNLSSPMSLHHSDDQCNMEDLTQEPLPLKFIKESFDESVFERMLSIKPSPLPVRIADNEEQVTAQNTHEDINCNEQPSARSFRIVPVKINSPEMRNHMQINIIELSKNLQDLKPSIRQSQDEATDYKALRKSLQLSKYITSPKEGQDENHQGSSMSQYQEMLQRRKNELSIPETALKRKAFLSTQDIQIQKYDQQSETRVKKSYLCNSSEKSQIYTLSEKLQERKHIKNQRVQRNGKNYNQDIFFLSQKSSDVQKRKTQFGSNITRNTQKSQNVSPFRSTILENKTNKVRSSLDFNFR